MLLVNLPGCAVWAVIFSFIVHFLRMIRLIEMIIFKEGLLISQNTVFQYHLIWF